MDYVARYNRAVYALTLLAEGRGREFQANEDWTSAMKHLASEELAKIATMRLRKTWPA